VLFTIGHSTRTIEEFITILHAHELELIVDVRRFPGSRRVPQFESNRLAHSLGNANIEYCWIESLGGRRRMSLSSPNVAWRNTSFRAYADHIATEEFAEGLFELEMLARGLRTAIMCSEILWWRCHRRIISDVLTFEGWKVEHIRDEKPAELHKLLPPARVLNGELVYR
jgi:uncharacterized protein (DUF488 family)